MKETVYRNYGARGPAEVTQLVAPNNEVQIERHRQVYQATHKGDGCRLPFMYRSFISFTYGGKYIEDFDLIATIVNNRLTKPGYAPFNDIVTTYDNLDGQYYWNTHYNANSLTFILSTDGIEQAMLDEFLFWFHAGEAKELILSEHPNRAIMARVAQPPQLSLLPFEYDTAITLSSVTYPAKTTLYKGDITLDFVMDEPHWYAVDNILGKLKDVVIDGETKKRYIDVWDDITKNPPEEVEIFASQDALKILVEDGIPLGSMIDQNMLLGNGAFANVQNNTDSLTWSLSEDQIEIVNAEPTGEGARINGTITDEEYADRSRLVVATEALQWLAVEAGEELWYDKEEDFMPDWREYHPGNYKGIIAGPIIDADGKGIEALSAGAFGHFFYSGTAPSPTIIEFDIMPTFDLSGRMVSIANSITHPAKPYNIFTVESVSKQELYITTPNLITSYNTAVEIIQNGTNTPVIQLQEDIMQKVRHPAVRAWANSLLSTALDISSVSSEVIADRMQQFFKKNEDEYAPMHFIFNSKNGSALGHFEYRRATQQLSLFNFMYEENAVNKIATLRSEDSNLTDQQRYENIDTWNWEQYCLDNENNIIVPTEGDMASYTRAVKAFINTLDKNIRSGTSMPGIFTAIPKPLSLSELLEATEDVGDMLRSNNIIIRDRNYPNEHGKIVHWENTIKGKTYSHRVYHDFDVPIENFQIQYRNMYL